MAQPFIGEIRMFAGNFAPAGWAFCDGQLLPISENDALFALIGTTYGGDGQSTFALPDLRGRLPLHQGNGFVLAETAGVEQVTLTVQGIPAHTHAFLATANPASATAPGNLVLGTTQAATITPYGTDNPTTPCTPARLGQWEAVSRTPTSSLICASISLSHCSGSFLRKAKRRKR